MASDSAVSALALALARGDRFGLSAVVSVALALVLAVLAFRPRVFVGLSTASETGFFVDRVRFGFGESSIAVVVAAAP